MQIVKHAGALILVSLCAAGAAEAAQPGFYIGASVGPTSHDVGPTRGIIVAFGPLPPGIPIGGGIAVAPRALLPDSVSVDDGELGWSGVLGYRINAHFAAELAYMDFGSADVVERYTISSPFLPSTFTRDYSIGVRGPAVTALASLPAGPVEVFLRAGLLFADAEIEQRFGIGRDTNTFGSEVLIAGIGVDWSFADRWAVRLEYQRTGELDATIVAGEDELDQFSLAVLFSL